MIQLIIEDLAHELPSLGELWSVSPSGSTTTESWPFFWPPIPGGPVA